LIQLSSIVFKNDTQACRPPFLLPTSLSSIIVGPKQNAWKWGVWKQC